MNIGEHIRKIRKYQGLTQQELAEKTGISLMSIRRYETGEREPRVDILERISEALNEPLLCFYGIQEFREENVENFNTNNINNTDGEYRAILIMLAQIYDKVEKKEIAGYDWIAQYYVISNAKGEKFILYDDDLAALHDATTAYLPAIITRLKDTRSEQEIIAECENWKCNQDDIRATIFEIEPLEDREIDN